jgi:hypothetical protein
LLYVYGADNDPGKQLEWFEKELEESEKAGHFVYILAHMSPGMQECIYDWSVRYFILVEKYQDIIRLQNFGKHFL